MPSLTNARRPLLLLPLTLLTAGLIALLLLGSSAAAASKRVVDEEENTALGRTVLTTIQGRTLYSLSAETKGRFFCTGGCLGTWRPLLVRAGVKPKGPVKLGTVKRPNGKIQVSYKGRPLYHFYGDSKRGEANGEGLKDVGTWHAATVTQTSAPPPQPAPEPPPYPY
jgi:predicted lipoprotein with Yx(FWY)xxD motif